MDRHDCPQTPPPPSTLPPTPPTFPRDGDGPEFRPGGPPARSPRKRPKRRLPPEVLTDGEVRSLMDACDADTATGVRHRALLAVLYRSGLRINEALQLRPKDVDAEHGTIRVLFGKRGYARTVGIDAGAMAIISEWTKLRAELGHNPKSPLFCSSSGRELPASFIRRLLPRLAQKAGIF
ncbi:MAG: tyrosine-type recombinase/integrase, partial [Pyrinomonadaceae bacterium]|nr:tyrosine-type recombinase/integrase [Phycisphaerales bacterium]